MLPDHRKPLFLRLWLVALAIAAAACAPPATDVAPQTQRLSEFGVYEGYSEARFDSWVTTSQYIGTRDGTRLAADISRPALDGVAADERFPVLWTLLAPTMNGLSYNGGVWVESR